MTALRTGALAGLAVASLLLLGCEREAEEAARPIRPIRAIQVGSADTFSDTWLPGRAKATQEVELSFEVPGKVLERPVFVGDAVEAGQIVARLDDRDYRNDLAKAEAERERAKAQLDRVEEAAKTGAVAQQDVTNARADFNFAEAEVQIAQKAVDDTVVKAPFHGTVSWIYVERFEDVQAKQPVLRIVDTSRIEFVVNIPEQYIAYIPSAEDIRVRFDAYPDLEVPAEIKEIGAEPSEATRTFPVNLIMEQPEDVKIMPGMAGKVSGRLPELAATEEAAIVVPVTAVFSPEGEQSYVWVIDAQSGTVSRRAVETGGLRNTGIPIAEGLEPGEWIATAGVHFLAEGQKVRLVQTGAEAAAKGDGG